MVESDVDIATRAWDPGREEIDKSILSNRVLYGREVLLFFHIKQTARQSRSHQYRC